MNRLKRTLALFAAFIMACGILRADTTPTTTSKSCLLSSHIRTVQTNLALVLLLSYNFGVSNNEMICQEILDGGKTMVSLLNWQLKQKSDCFVNNPKCSFCESNSEIRATIFDLVSRISKEHE